jgi:WD40 repeat protein
MFNFQPNRHPTLHAIVHDAKRFILNNRSIMEKAPLQSYASALVFSPKQSLIRNCYLDQFPTWIQNLHTVDENWSPSFQTLEGHTGLVSTVVFSPDGQLLASGSVDHTVRLWHPKTGAQLRKFDAQGVVELSFSPDGSYNKTNCGHIQLTPVSSYNRSRSLSSSPWMINRIWLTWHTYKVLWLPPDFRPCCLTTRGSLFAMGYPSGRVMFLELNWISTQSDN